MPKTTTSKAKERSVKKAKLAEPIDAKRIKGSPRPSKVQKKLPEADSETPVVSKSLKDKGKGKEKPTLETKLPTAFKIIAGSYEKLLYGLEGTVTASDSWTTIRLYFQLETDIHISCSCILHKICSRLPL
jgi:protein MAK11